MAKRKWKGTITKDLRSAGRALANMQPEFKKGDQVIAWKKRMLEPSGMDDRLEFRGRYEYHYSDANGKGLVRTTRFLIAEFDEPDLG